MDTHSMIFVTIDKLVSPPHFRLRRTNDGADWPAPSEQKICTFSAAQAVGSVVSFVSLTRQDVYS